MYLTNHARQSDVLNENGKWIAAWGTSPVDFNIALKEIIKMDVKLINVLRPGTTSRTELTVTGSGEMVRLHFSNEYGRSPIIIDAVSIARCDPTDPAGIISGTDKDVTFSGKKTLEIKPGERIVSDDIVFPVSALEKLSVSMYYQNKTIVNTCGLYSAVTYTSNKHKISQTDRTFLRTPIKFSLSSGTMGCNFIPFLTGIDVFSNDEDASCIVMIGDSTFCNDAYIHLEERLLSSGQKRISVINKAISGNKLLNYGCGLIGSFYGKPVMERFEEDVLNQPGVKAVIMKVGINDITHPHILSMKGKAVTVTAHQMFEGYEKLASLCHERGIKFYLSKIAPWNGYEREILGKKGDLTWTEEQYDLCLEVNDWIVNSRAIDGYIDTDELADPEDATRLYKPFTTDCMHFSPLGAIAFSDIVPLSFFGVKNEGALLLETKYRYFPREMNQRTEESGDFGEGMHQAARFVSQMFDHIRPRRHK